MPDDGLATAINLRNTGDPVPRDPEGSLANHDKTLFDNAVAALRGDVAAAAATLTNDSAVRQAYQRTIEAVVADLQQKVRTGTLTWTQAAEQANEIRNVTMETARVRSSPVGRALAEQIKSKGKTLNELIAKYTIAKFGPEAQFNSLTVAEKELIYGEIVAAASRSNPRVNASMLRWSRAGRGLIFLSLAVSVYNVANADDKVAAAGHEAAVTGAGIAGGMAGGALAGLACGPGAPVCVTIGAFVGGAAAAFGVDFFF